MIVITWCVSLLRSAASRFRYVWLMLAFSFVATQVHAQEDFDAVFQSANYQMLVADYNGDGRLDILMKSVPRLLIVDVEESLVIFTPTKAVSFALLSSFDGEYLLIASPDAALLNFPGWRGGTSTLKAAGGAGSAGIYLIRSAINAHPDFTVSLSSENGQLQLESTVWPGFGPSCD